MNLLTPAVQDNAYLKAAFRGNSGSGKTWAAAAITIGLHPLIGSTKPIAFWDTENALSYVLPHFKANGIEVLELKSRRFADARSFFDEIKGEVDIAIIDSITHIWKDLVRSYMEANHKKKLAVWDWGRIKPQYEADVLENIIQCELHLLLCGRLQDIFGYIEVDDEKVLATTGSKMNAEKSTEYEPSLTVEMERFTYTDDELKELGRMAKDNKGGYAKINKVARYRMTIIKDRANVLAGMYEFEPMPGGIIKPDNEIFLAVKPFCDALNIGGEHKGLDMSGSKEIFGKVETDYYEKKQQRKILVEKIEAELSIRYKRSDTDKKKKVQELKDWFGTASWAEISERLPIEQLEYAYGLILEANTKAEKPKRTEKVGDEKHLNTLAKINTIADQAELMMVVEMIDYPENLVNELPSDIIEARGVIMKWYQGVVK